MGTPARSSSCTRQDMPSASTTAVGWGSAGGQQVRLGDRDGHVVVPLSMPKFQAGPQQPATWVTVAPAFSSNRRSGAAIAEHRRRVVAVAAATTSTPSSDGNGTSSRSSSSAK